jgi:chromosome segregation ATPase
MDSLVGELKNENERLAHQEKALKLRIKDLEIKISEEEGVWEVTRERLDEKEAKIKQLEKLLSENVDHNKELSNQLNELDHKNHELNKEKHRITRMYDELKKDENEFKATSFRNYEAAVSENLSELHELRQNITRLTESNEALATRLE